MFKTDSLIDHAAITLSMGKKYGKSRKGNPNRARSKNNPNGKRNDPKINWPEYNKGRDSEGENYLKGLVKIADKAREMMGIEPGTRDKRVSAILVAIIKSEEDLSYWGLIKHFQKHPEDLRRCELIRGYSRSTYHRWIQDIDTEMLQKIIVWLAGDDAIHNTLVADSSGFSIAKFIEWQHAKYGKLKVSDFAKLHLIHTLHGKICAATVTPGKRNDSPRLRWMVRMRPEGSGHVIADSMYGGKKNCNAIRDSGRTPIIEPKEGYKIKGLNARARMLRFFEEHPRTFYNILKLRNNVESVFSSVKTRYNGMVRALKEHTQAVELLSKCICYNLTFA